MTLQKVVRKLAELTLGELPPTLGKELADACAQHNNNNDNNTNDNNNNYNNNHTHNNNNNNDNNNNKNSRESGLNSLDLDNDNPESEPDLDDTSLVSFNPAMGVESSLGSLDQQEADLSFEMTTKWSSLGSLDQDDEEESSSSFDQEGENYRH